MRNFILITLILCFLSTQVLGSVVYENEHKKQGDLHGLIHELGQPHSHYHDNEDKFELSYSTEAIEHVGQDVDCSVVALVNTSPIELTNRKPSDAVVSYASDWSPPFLQHIKPPPRH
jgi:hypothetical protein